MVREPRVSGKAIGKGAPLAPAPILFGGGDYGYRFWMGDLPMGTTKEHDTSVAWNNLIEVNHFCGCLKFIVRIK